MVRGPRSFVTAGRLDSSSLRAAAIVYAILAALIAGVYLAVVVGLAKALDADIPNTGLSILAIAIAAVAFRPARERAQALANRLVFGSATTPFDVLTRFSDRVAETYASEDVLPRIAATVGEATAAERVEVWLGVGDELLFAASWPTETRVPRRPIPLAEGAVPPFVGSDRVIDVRHQGELLGALVVAKRPGDAMTPAQDQLLSDVASQAGMVLRNVRLTAELAARLQEVSARAAEIRASRQRIVEAHDAERRRLERDIHDGAQQHLVALAVKLRLAKGFAARDAARADETLTDLRRLVDDSLENLRDLSRGIYPPVLTGRGPAAALRAQARRSGVPITVEAEGVRRYGSDVEAAVYFCCLEAMQNAAKHAGASCVRMRLEEAGGELIFSVTDDGAGFDPRTAPGGSGLVNMEDRLAVVGGHVEVRSAPGAGTSVIGRIPVEPRGRKR